MELLHRAKVIAFRQGQRKISVAFYAYTQKTKSPMMTPKKMPLVFVFQRQMKNLNGQFAVKAETAVPEC